MCFVFLRISRYINRPRKKDRGNLLHYNLKKDFGKLPRIKPNLSNIWLSICLIRKIGRWYTISLNYPLIIKNTFLKKTDNQENLPGNGGVGFFS
jgi:hypothetical protein